MNLQIPTYNKTETKIRIGDLVALMCVVQYEKIINENTVFYDCSDPIHKNLKADIIFNKVINVSTKILENTEKIDCNNLWVVAPHLLSKYGNKILPKLNLQDNLYSGTTLPQDDFIVLSTLLSPEYNFQRRMEIDFINNLIKSLELSFKHIYVITDQPKKIIQKTAKIINTSSLYDIIYLISKAKIFIGGDTGFTHFAAIARVPNIISIYGENYFYPEFVKTGKFKNIPFNCMPLVDDETTNHFSFILEHNELSPKQIVDIIEISKKQLNSNEINSLDIIEQYILLENKKNSANLLKDYLKSNPTSAKAWRLLATTYYKDHKELVQNAFAKSIELDPKNINTYLDLAKFYYYWTDYNDSTNTLLAILDIEPNNADSYLWLSYNQLKLNNMDNRFECAKQAYELNQKNPLIIDNLGRIVKELGDYQTAQELFKEAIKYNATYAPSYFHLAQTQLALDNYEDGLGNYEWRYFITSSQRMRTLPYPMPRYKGENLSEKSIFIHHEQGFGDTIQFTRYVSILLATCKKIKILVQPSLKKLLEENFNNITFIDKVEDSYDCNYHASLLSLPSLLKIYTPADEISLKVKLKKLKQIKKGKLNVGIVWQGSKGHINDHNRSISTDALHKLNSLKNIQLYSLQKDATKKDLNNISKNIIDLVRKSKDFYNTAQLIQELDLVISVDTSVAHLAASLGKPTWILLPHIPDWRWGLKNTNTPWYKSVTLFRKKQAQPWEEIINMIYDKLKSSTIS